MRIEKTLIAAGLQATNKSDWVGMVLLYDDEDKAIYADRNITEVKYDHNDGRGPVTYNADKIRAAKRRHVTSKSGRRFVIYKIKDIT